MPNKEEIIAAIAEEEKRIADLEKQKGKSKSRLDQLKAELTSLSGAQPVSSGSYQPPDVEVPQTSDQKVVLFRRLFRGREDVFAKHWSNPKTGKKGYSPACFNEWVREVCKKPKVKCGECPNQAFIPISDQVLLDHMLGRYVVGVYPLLSDETCFFLAADFDKQSWADDVAAFVDTCRNIGLEPAVERSRSGKGAHVWFFFDSPIPATLARTMGCHLITETMDRYHQLSMDSYDRLFPNQDTMPQGGFGNLIALPFQNEARLKGNSVFLDENFQPYSNQWACLSFAKILDQTTVETIAKEARRKGKVIGLQIDGVDERGENKTPWVRSSSKTKAVQITEPIPEKVKAVFSQSLFIEKKGLPSNLINQIKRLGAFQNPEFYKKQSMRLSTALTPLVVCCTEDFPDHVSIPRGCLPDLEALLGNHGSRLVIDDKRNDGSPIDVEFSGVLTELQSQAVKEMSKHELGIFVAPPGIGKTVVGIYLIAQRAKSVLILVHRKPLLDQWKAQLSLFLGIDPKEIGQIGSGKRKANGRIDIAMIQSLVRKGKVDDIVADYDHIIVDECHHVSAFSFERVLSEAKARYVLGLTATPQRRDGHHPIIKMQCGPIRFCVDQKEQTAQRPFNHKLLIRETGFRADEIESGASIQALYGLITADEDRNQLILNDVISAVEEGRSPILLTERKGHLEFFAEKLQGFVRHLVILQGGVRSKKRKEMISQLASIPENEERLILATGRYIGEGFDDARLDTLFLAMPVSWKGTLIQYAGRLHRLHPGKEEVRIYDYVDKEVPVFMRMFEKRLRGYRSIGYEQGDLPAEKEIIETKIELE